ncbi:hypothetical protein SprV_0301126100 [Sparganum proliferum]
MSPEVRCSGELEKVVGPKGAVQDTHDTESLYQVTAQLPITQRIEIKVFNVLPNGAYSVAVSSKGTYRLQLAAPQGWNFVPKDGYDIQITGTGQNEEYVFFLTGFDVSGQVATAGMKTGPPNLYVSVLAVTESPSPSSVVITQSKTTADGSFILSSLSPGEYLVTVSDSKRLSGPEDVRSSTKITVSTSSFRMPKPLVLQGHVLRSSVTFAGRGIARILVLLYISKANTLTKADLEKFGCSKVPGKSSYPVPKELLPKIVEKPVCQALTDSEGAFSFSRLAGGEYFVVAHHEASLTPELKSQRLLIEPPFLRAQMEHRDFLLEPGFQVTAFHLSGGRVQLSNIPIVGAKIIVDGMISAESDKTGFYELMISKPGKYKIEVTLPKYQFPESVVELTPMTDRLPNFSPSSVQLCGMFLFSSSSKINQQDLPVVQFADGSHVIESAVATLSADHGSAKFCTYLPPGKHSLRLTNFSDFVRFSPSSLLVDLSVGPPKDLLFTQFQAKVEGEIFCAVDCTVAAGQQLAVKLVPSDGRSADELTYFAYVQADPKSARHAIYFFDSVFPGAYEVQLVMVPDTEPSPLITFPANNWCWAPSSDQEKASHPRLITIVDKNLDVRSTPSLRFEQTGFRIHLEAPLLDAGFDRPVDFTVAPLDDHKTSKKHGHKAPANPVSSAKSVHYTFTKPVSTICLPKEPQSISFEAKTDCLRLATPQPSIVHLTKDVPVSNPAFSVQLQVSELPINVTVEVSAEFVSLSELSMPHLLVEAAIEKPDKTVNPTIPLASTWEKHGEKYVAKSGLWVAPGDLVHLAVRPSPDSVSAVYPLIVPSTRTVRIPGPLSLHSSHYDVKEVFPDPLSKKTPLLSTDCSTALRRAFGDLSAVFVMQPGFFFTGSVVPPVDKVLVSVFADEELVSYTLPTEPIDLSDFSDMANEALPTLVTRTLTNATGFFKIGPVYFHEGGRSVSPSSLLTVRLQKPGYEFSQKTPDGDKAGSADHLWTFSSHKLALVELKLADEAGNPLQNTLVTIVGSAYRGSETTGSSGLVRYVGLPPGEYYLQPMLKEYEFMIRKGSTVVSLMEHAVSVVEGGSISLGLVGKRVAFSAFGKVTSLSGFPEADVIVEAKMISKAEIGDKQRVYPPSDAEPAVECRQQSSNVGFPYPLEQAVTGRDGQFKLRGLFPGCFYSVTVGGQSMQKAPDTLDEFVEHSAAGTQHTVPRSIVVRMTTEDVSGLHFFLTPLVSMGTISATVDTLDLLLPGLSIVIHPVNQPERSVVRHKFSVGSRLFFLSGKQLQPLLGGAYTILLEANFNPSVRDQNTTVQKFDFNLRSTSSHHFSFTYLPNVDANSRI